MFEETLKKCQEVIESDDEKAKTICAVGDFNFSFIQWPSKTIYSREEEPENKSSEKIQAKMMLNWAEQNFFEQHIKSATRKNNILDLVFTNSNSLVNGYTTIVSKSFSDHNILRAKPQL